MPSTHPRLVRDERIYHLVFQRAETLWNQYCQLQVDRQTDESGYVLIEQYNDEEKGRCTGPVCRAWLRDISGIRELELPEHRRLSSRGQGPSWRYIHLMFFIFPDKTRIIMGDQEGGRWGTGLCYVLRETNTGLQLDVDPEGGGWIA